MPDAATEHLDATAMRLAVSWGFAKRHPVRTMGVRTSFLNADLKGWRHPPLGALAQLGVEHPDEYRLAHEAPHGFGQETRRARDARATLCPLRGELFGSSVGVAAECVLESRIVGRLLVTPARRKVVGVPPVVRGFAVTSGGAPTWQAPGCRSSGLCLKGEEGATHTRYCQHRLGLPRGDCLKPKAGSSR